MVDDKDTTPPASSSPPEPTPVAAPAPVGDAIRAAFADYLATQDVPTGPGNEVQVDLEFLKQHAGPMIVHMLRGATQSLMPRELKLSLTTPAKPADGKAADGAAGADGAEGRPPLNLSFDLGDFLARLLDPPKRG